MLSERISTLFALLGCSNTEIARYAGCSSGNISKLKTGNREPKPTSRSIASFVNGVYGYADYENMLPTLQELCRSPDTTRDALLPALISWLYDFSPEEDSTAIAQVLLRSLDEFTPDRGVPGLVPETPETADDAYYWRIGILLKMFVIVTNIFEIVPLSFYYQCFSAFLFVNSSPEKT